MKMGGRPATSGLHGAASPRISGTREPWAPTTVAASTNHRLREMRLLRTTTASAEEGGAMDTVMERCAGLDVHKDTVAACVRFPGASGERVQEIHTFGTTAAELLALRDWLAAHRVSLVGMESTGIYWRPVYYVLEDALECWLLNAGHLRNVPRYRKAQIEERTREAQRLEKILQDAGMKLSSVATDILGVSGRAMLSALVEGTRDPEILSELARGQLRKKLPQLKEALAGRFGAHHALLVGTILSHLEFLDEAIEHLSAEIEQVIAPFEAEVELVRTIPGVARRTAESLIAEIGVDMGRFGSSARLASWAGMCPGNTGGKHRSGKTRKGSKWLRTALIESARAASRSKGTYLSAQYHRLRGRRGNSRATVAVGHSILVAAYHILDRRQPYTDLGADYFVHRHDPQHHANRLGPQLLALGYDVTLEPVEAA